MTTFFTFYSKSKERKARLLSNFAEIPVKLDHVETGGGGGGTLRRTYPTGEHAFHAAKYRCAAGAPGVGPARRRQLLEHAEKFASAAASTPLDAKRLGGKGKQGGKSTGVFGPKKRTPISARKPAHLQRIHALTSNFGHFGPLFGPFFNSVVPFLIKKGKIAPKSGPKSGQRP